MRKLALFLCLIIPMTHTLSQMVPCTSIFQEPIFYGETTFPRTDDIVIPVVFHVLDFQGLATVSTADINRLLETLNDDFTLTNSERTSLLSAVSGTPGSVGFRFAFAEVDPEGNPTSGVLRVDTDVADIGDKVSIDGISVIKNTAAGGSTPWDLENYVNIWIGERSISLGSTITSNSKSSDLEGIIIANASLSESPKTISHEMGHYFGLLHPWGNFTGCDDEGDGIEDTPFQARPDFDCQSILNCGNYTLPGNMMDFTEDACLQYFTKMQASAIQQFSTKYKSELTNSADCFFENLPLGQDFVITNAGFGSVEIYFDSRSNFEDVLLFDMQGKLIIAIASKGQNFLNIPTRGIPSGIYVLQIVNTQKRLAKKIFIK